MRVRDVHVLEPSGVAQRDRAVLQRLRSLLMDGVALDTARLHKEHADLLKDYTIVKPGSRRFLVQT